MKEPVSVQQVFFQHVKEHLPAHLSLVDEVAELLNISNDSAYRRIRGEKALSFEEIRTLCSHFRISLDQLFHLANDTVLFSGRFINHHDFDFAGYLQELLRLLIYANSFDRKEMLFMSKDLPIFYHFMFPELSAFKSFFWMKTILQSPAHGKKRFAAEESDASIAATGTRIFQEYVRLPSQEIWTDETIHATLRQIEYYKDTKMFASDKDLEKVYACLHKTVDHMEAQAELGCKFYLAGERQVMGAALKIYINEFVLGDNTYLVCMNDSKMVLLNHSVLNTIRTQDPQFTRYTEEHFQNIIRKSTQISGVGEKERSKFFHVLRETVELSRRR